jgi:short-subunit dehydrogenase
MGNSLRPAKCTPGSVVVITGASSGIGEEVAYRYSRRGYKIVISSRTRADLSRVAEGCKELGAHSVLAVQIDVREERDCMKLIEETIQAYGRIDILVLNAGISAHFEFNSHVNTDIYKKLMDTNFYGYLYPTKYAWSYLKESQGQIIVISSISGELGLPGRSAYCASKFAVMGFFESLRMDDPHLDITIICPPSIKTQMREHSSKEFCLEGVTPERVQDKRMSVDKCVDVILLAADKRSRKIIFPLSSIFAVYMRPFIPQIIDPLVRRTSKL